MIRADGARAAASRWAAAGLLALALPVVPLAVAAVGAGTLTLGILGGGAAGLAALAAWLGPAAWPGTGRAPAVERVLVTATVAWVAALDAAIGGMAVHGGDASITPGPVGLTAGVYVLGSMWSIRTPAEVWWRWPVACALTGATWIVTQAAA